MSSTSPQSSPRPSRPGRMTSVMRAVAQQSGPKILRIGVVRAGKVVDERLMKARDTVSIGPSEKATFVIASKKIPPTFKLFERVGNGYRLNFLDGMTGRVALTTGVSELTALKGQAKTGSIGGATAYRVPLGEDARGKVKIGDTTFLFQFVAPPPVQPKPQLPMSVRSGVAGDIDWFTTIVAAFSFLFHFFLVALVYSDWMDPIVDDDVAVTQLLESVKSLPPPQVEKVEAEVDTEATAEATTDTPTKKPTKTATKAGGKGSGKAAGKAGTGKAGEASADAKAADIASQLADLNVETLSALGTGGVATQGVLNDGDVPTGLLDDAARSNMGAGSGTAGGLKNLGGSGTGAVRPGAGGGGGRLSDIGNKGTGTGNGAAAAGTAKKPKGPKGSAMVGGASVAGGKVGNAGSVVARMRGRFRRCYQQGLNSNPDMAGSVTLTAKIGPNGEVLGVGGGGGGSLGSIVPCLKAVVRGGGFSPPEGGSAIVAIPITFVKQ